MNDLVIHQGTSFTLPTQSTSNELHMVSQAFIGLFCTYGEFPLGSPIDVYTLTERTLKDKIRYILYEIFKQLKVPYNLAGITLKSIEGTKIRVLITTNDDGETIVEI